ncbi:MAG: 3-hydroxyacyl-ACP dehydratase FabZ [Firmicutes bacterium]|jgi:3-hydroxyacyl-[acyl-carrier-protein] dehydratase|nr:3-hydroxyacyl-ACP dehydratase FabZ [Bacillota bacterium]
MLDILAIQNRLPHRYPFLMVDRVVELLPGKRAVAIKNVTVNEPHFTGHYPGRPIMPGVLILETLAQVGGLVVMDPEDGTGKKIPLLAGVDKARFRRPVVPGDQLRLEVEMLQLRRSMGKCHGIAYVGDEKAAEAEFMFMIADPE